MFNRKPPPEDPVLDEAIKMCQRQMQNLKVESVEYRQATERLKDLYALKPAQKRSFDVSPDTVLVVVANLVGIILIIQHEKTDIITSKAMGFVRGLR